jgi:hypothetical protein
MTIKETAEKIRTVGPQNVRKVVSTNGLIDIQINEGGSWKTLTTVNAAAADDIIRQATNKILLG